MFNWIEKVIPQPPETPRKSISDGQECVAPPVVVTAKCDEKAPCVDKEVNNSAGDTKDHDSSSAADKGSGGVLSWLAQGLGKVVPQPVDSPTLCRASKEVVEPVVVVVEEKPKPVIEPVEKKTENGPTEQTESSSVSVLSWLSHGLEKVIPQPTWTHRPSVTSVTEPCAPPVEQKVQVEVEEKPEKTEGNRRGKEASPRAIATWIIKVAQHAYRAKVLHLVDVSVSPVSPPHSPTPSPVMAPSPVPSEPPPAPPIAAEVAAPDKGSGSGVITWLMQGLGKVVPQPETTMAVPKKVEEEKPKEEEPPPPPPAVRKDSKTSTENIGVLSWISQGLEKVIPQPVSKQGSQNVTLGQVEEKGSGA